MRNLTLLWAVMLGLLRPVLAEDAQWWPANNTAKVRPTGAWQWTSHRYAADQALVTAEDGAQLELSYQGRALVLCLDTLTPDNYGKAELGVLEVAIDGGQPRFIHPQVEANEIVLARSSAVESHRVQIVHRAQAAGSGCRIRGFRVVTTPSGEIALTVNGQRNGALIDVHATLMRHGQVVRESYLRNRFTGECRLAGIPPGDEYMLEVRAAGWVTWRSESFAVRAGNETRLSPLFFAREWDLRAEAFKYPTFGQAVVRRADETFRTRFEANQAEIRGVRLVRQQGPARISRRCVFEEDKTVAFYYHREGTVHVPAGTPPGLYDLEIAVGDRKGSRTLVSPRAVNIVRRFPADPLFIGWGHLDTWGQYQAEYVRELVGIANLLTPDVVLVSNEANPAYVAGALSALEVPFVANFGNHRAPEPGPWFGESVGVIDFGRALTVLNFGRPWDTGLADAHELLGARADFACKVVNGYEANAPIEAFLDRYGVSLLHYAHGPGPAVAKFGATPTVRVGKTNSESFRVIRFQGGRPASYTYRGSPLAPVPFARGAKPPVRVVYEPANDGTHREITARFVNELEEDFPGARAVVVLPKGEYQVDGGTIEETIESDDGKFTVVSARFLLPAKQGGVVRVYPR